MFSFLLKIISYDVCVHVSELNECLPGICNTGICQDAVAGFNCICDDTGYTGETCEESKKTPIKIKIIFHVGCIRGQMKNSNT